MQPNEQASDRIRAQHRTNFDAFNQRLAATSMGEHVRFLNFGYEPLPGDPPPAIRVPPRFPKADSARLLAELIGTAPLADERVIEIGCGRGGNLWFLRTMVGTGAVIGIDLAYSNVAHAASGVTPPGGFAQGDAERLPLADACTSVVLSVESASAYPDIENFFREVHRILRPGGLFLYADTMPADRVPAYRRVLAALSFRLLTTRDITPNVIAARARRGERERRTLVAQGDDELGGWVGAPGSAINDELIAGGAQYRLWRLERGTGSAPPQPLFRDEERDAHVRWAQHSADALQLGGEAPR